jgi:RND superfamily putative drug exporter
VSRFLTVPAGRTAKFVVVAVCVVALFASGAANLPGKYSDAENNESTSFLPGDAESTEVLSIADDLQGGEQAPIVIVYRREGGLTGQDRARIAANRVESTGRSRRTRATSTAPSRRSSRRASPSPATRRC